MATIDSTLPTLAELAKRLDPDGKIDYIVSLLAQTNEVLEDMPWMEGNLPTGHRSTIQKELAVPTWRRLNEGVSPGYNKTEQITDNCAMLEAFGQCDVELANLANNKAQFLMSESKMHIESMNQEFASTLFYGDDRITPQEFLGFAPRYNALSGIENADNIIDGGSNDTDNTSIWLVIWDDMCHGIYPKGSTAGLKVEDLGEDVSENAGGANKLMRVYRQHYQMKAGLTIRDWRKVVRIANIEVSDLTNSTATSGADLIDLMTIALDIPPSLSAGRPVFYCNRTVKSFLRRQIVNKVAGSTLTMDQVAGKPVMTFGGVPVRRCDAILNTETRLT